jgi:uncharacterized damage-inducible protein DinB
MNPEIDSYTKELRRLFGRLYDSLDGLNEQELNWHPPAAEANSIYAIATHTLGNARAWILGICCGQPIERDRPAEFRASGKDAAHLIENARLLLNEIEMSLRALQPDSLGERREPRQQLWGAGTAEPVTGREAIMHAVSHAAEHIGHIGMTRDLAKAAVG